MSEGLAEQYRKIAQVLKRFEHQQRLDEFFRDAKEGNDIQFRRHDWESIKLELAVLREIAKDNWNRGKKL